MLPGLEQSPARDTFVAAAHHTSAEGICRQNNIVYQRAGNMDELQQGINALLSMEGLRPVLLEVFTDAEVDKKAYQDWFSYIKSPIPTPSGRGRDRNMLD